MSASAPPCERASNRPTGASSSRKRKWTPGWSRCCAHRMRIRWTPAAAADLEHIGNYLEARHPQYRQPTMRKLYEAIRSLREWPYRGRVGREDGTRELLFPPLPYIAVYRVEEQSIEVLRIYHAAQARP